MDAGEEGGRVTCRASRQLRCLEKGGHQVHYLRQPFKREPDFGATGVLYDFADLLARAREPS